MQNVIVTTLEQKIKELNTAMHAQRKAVLNSAVDSIQKLLISINPIFAGWVPEITDYSLTLKQIIGGYHREACEIKFSHTTDRENNWKYIYQLDKTQLSWSSRNASEDFEFNSGIIIGILCGLRKENSYFWQAIQEAFVAYHNTLHELHNSPDYTKTRNDVTLMETQVRDITIADRNSAIDTIYNKGEMKLSEAVSFQFGGGKRDRIYHDNFKWEIKQGQKTARFGYMSVTGHEVPQPYFYCVKERMPLDDLRSFIASHIKKVIA